MESKTGLHVQFSFFASWWMVQNPRAPRPLHRDFSQNKSWIWYTYFLRCPSMFLRSTASTSPSRSLFSEPMQTVCLVIIFYSLSPIFLLIVWFVVDFHKKIFIFYHKCYYTNSIYNRRAVALFFLKKNTDQGMTLPARMALTASVCISSRKKRPWISLTCSLDYQPTTQVNG